MRYSSCSKIYKHSRRKCVSAKNCHENDENQELIQLENRPNNSQWQVIVDFFTRARKRYLTAELYNIILDS
jgi:hypothetical protein